MSGYLLGQEIFYKISFYNISNIIEVQLVNLSISAQAEEGLIKMVIKVM